MKQQTIIINQTLFDSYKRGNEQAFAKIYESCKDFVFFTVLKMIKMREDTEEVTLKVFLNLWLSRDKIDNPVHLKRFLFIAAKNESINFLRSRKYSMELTDDIENGTVDINVLENEILFVEVIANIWKAVKELPRIRQKIFLLKYQEKKTVEEIGVLLNIKHQTVFNHLVRAKKQLYDLLK